MTEHMAIGIDLKRIEAKLREITARFPKRGVTEKLSNILWVIETYPDLKRRLARLQKTIKLLQFTIVIVVGLLIAGIVKTAFWPSTEFVIPIQLPLTFSDLLQSIETFTSLIVGLVIGLFFLTRILENKHSEMLLDKLEIIHETIHLFDLIHVGKAPESLGFDDEDSPQRERVMRREMSYVYLTTLHELVLLSGKIGIVFGRESADSAVLGKVQSIESLSHNTAFSIWRKIELLRNF